MSDCPHCQAERARLKPPNDGVLTPGGAPLNPKSLLLDGAPGGRPTLYPASEIVACPCRCHELWKFTNGVPV